MSNSAYAHLLAPVQLGDLALRNRVVMAPMTRSRAGVGDVPTEMIATYYRQRATAGMIISEGSQISPQGKGYPRTPGCFSPEQLAGWRLVTDAVHSEGGVIVLQLWHCGRMSHSSLQPGGALPVSASTVACEGQIYTAAGLQDLEAPRALEIDEISGVVGDFAVAAQLAKDAGFDGVELHAANGYLIDQFLRDGTNQREDCYGGSPENRFRFLGDVIDAVAGVFGASRVGVRLSPVFSTYSMVDSDPASSFGYYVERLGAYGLAYLHVIEFGTLPFDFAALRRRYAGTYIANGAYDGVRAEAAIVGGHADAVSFGSAYVANPDLVSRFARDVALAAPDPVTFYQGEESGYIDYPAAP